MDTSLHNILEIVTKIFDGTDAGTRRTFALRGYHKKMSNKVQRYIKRQKY